MARMWGWWPLAAVMHDVLGELCDAEASNHGNCINGLFLKTVHPAYTIGAPTRTRRTRAIPVPERKGHQPWT